MTDSPPPTRQYRSGTCQACGALRTILALGHCRECYRLRAPATRCLRCGRPIQHSTPGRLRICGNCHQPRQPALDAWLTKQAGKLPIELLDWTSLLATELTELCEWKLVRKHLLAIERVTRTAGTDPAAIVEALDKIQPATATITAEFLARHGLIPDADPATRLRQWLDRHLLRISEPMRPAISAFITELLDQQERALLYGTSGLTDRTIKNQLLFLAQLSHHLNKRGIDDWATVTTNDIESFLTVNPINRLTAARHFFAFARRRKSVLTDPTKGIKRHNPVGYRGRLLTQAEQRSLLHRWNDPATDPRERITGLLCLLHAASNRDVRNLTLDDIDLDEGTIRLGNRRPAPLDQVTHRALQDCLTHRDQIATTNRHLIITHLNRLHDGPCSNAFPLALVSRAGVTTRDLRQTRLADLAHRLDPRVLADAIGISKGAALNYLAGTIDHEALAFNQQGAT